MNSMSPGPSEVSRPTRSPGFSSTGPEVVRSCTPISRAISMASVVFPSPGGPKKRVWSSVSPRCFGRIDGDLQRGLHLRLADEFVQPRRPERRIGAGLFGQGFGGGDLRVVVHRLRIYSTRTKSRTSRENLAQPAVVPRPVPSFVTFPSFGFDAAHPPHRPRVGLARACRRMAVHAAVARWSRAEGTSLRLVVPQRVQFHSAVVAATVIGRQAPSTWRQAAGAPAG